MFITSSSHLLAEEKHPVRVCCCFLPPKELVIADGAAKSVRHRHCVPTIGDDYVLSESASVYALRVQQCRGCRQRTGPPFYTTNRVRFEWENVMILVKYFPRLRKSALPTQAYSRKPKNVFSSSKKPEIGKPATGEYRGKNA